MTQQIERHWHLWHMTWKALQLALVAPMLAPCTAAVANAQGMPGTHEGGGSRHGRNRNLTPILLMWRPGNKRYTVRLGGTAEAQNIDARARWVAHMCGDGSGAVRHSMERASERHKQTAQASAQAPSLLYGCTQATQTLDAWSQQTQGAKANQNPHPSIIMHPR
jgi:hypothetical protein